MSTAQQIIKKLELQAHPEGGYYKRTYLQQEEYSSCIYYMLEHGDKSHWHTITTDEILFFHCGAPLTAHIISAGRLSTYTLGGNILAGEQGHLTVAANSILEMSVNSNEPGAYSLLSCVVSPQFKFENFKLYNTQEILQLCPNIDKKLLLEFTKG